ncbi:MAG: histidine phosphatase family protein [Eubacteriales bacterium]|nr:histidine phosphatase family protein [Eubacteriales bacterium]
MDRLYLIRHGLTQYNIEKRYCGASDVPLTEEEKERLKSFCRSLPSDAKLITSGMRRCNETAEALFGNVRYRTDARFREIDFGIFEGHTYEELLSVNEYRDWCGTDGRSAPPNGESAAEFEKRVDGGIHELLCSDGSFVLVTHGGVIAHIMHRLFPDERKSRYQWQPEHGEGYLVCGSSYSALNL